MNRPTNPAGIAPAYTRRSRARLTLAIVTAVVGGLLALSPLAPATAGSEECRNGTYSEVPLVSGDLGLPLWVSVEHYAPGEPGGSVCYGTAAPGDPKLTGGRVYAYTRMEPSEVVVAYGQSSDSNGAVQATANGDARPTYTINAQQITVAIPVNFCTGAVCYPPAPNDANIGTTGVIIGTIEQTPAGAGGTSAAYRLTALCVQVDGQTVLGNCTSGIGAAGATTTGTGPLTSQSGTPGPCVLGSVCAPQYDYVGTTGNQLATVWVPVLGPIPVYGVHTCLYTKDTNTSCPA